MGTYTLIFLSLILLSCFFVSFVSFGLLFNTLGIVSCNRSITSTTLYYGCNCIILVVNAKMLHRLITFTVSDIQKYLKKWKVKEKNDTAEQFGIPVCTLFIIIKNRKEFDLNYSSEQQRKKKMPYF